MRSLRQAEQSHQSALRVTPVRLGVLLCTMAAAFALGVACRRLGSRH